MLRRVAGPADHEDVIHKIVDAFSTGDYIVDGQLLGTGDLGAAVPTNIRILNFGDIVLQEIMNVPPTFLVSFVSFGPDSVTRFVFLAFTHINRRLKKIQIGICPIEVFSESLEFGILFSGLARGDNHMPWGVSCS